MGARKLLSIGGLTLLLIFLSLDGVAQARSSYAGTFVKINRSMAMEDILASKETCEQCHQKVTPMVSAQHQDSAHQKQGIGCADCHGTDHRSLKIVTAQVCAQCHEQEVKEARASKHAQSWKKAWNNSRYWSISEPMRRQGCERCHDIGYNFSDVRCDYCHTTHQFSASEARQPQACTTCHMGPDHPQAEALAGSKHAGKVTCVDCHQVQGSHDVSKNIGIGGVSNGGLLEDWTWAINPDGTPKLKRTVVTNEQFNQAREGNLAICADCHDRQFNEQWLNGADQVKMAIEQMLVEAQGLVEDLEQEGLLFPDPKTRPPIPGEGQKLVLGGNQLYIGTSKAEAIYFKMYKFAAAQGWKSAYHQDFQRAGTKGILEMQSLMTQLQQEASVLRALKADDSQAPQGSPPKITGVSVFTVAMGVAGALLGTGLAMLYFRIKRRGQAIVPLVLLLGLIGSFWWSSGTAWAWDGQGGEAQDCNNCHAEQVKQLQEGEHRTLGCLDCHQTNAKRVQAREPETCGKCHTAEMGEDLEVYLTSPHGVQYQTKGQDQWVPLCATCHMPKGAHNLRTQITDQKNGYDGQIGEVCRSCHTTDHVDKFTEDLKAIQKENQKMSEQLRGIGLKLIDDGIIRPTEVNMWAKPADYRDKWAAESQWQLVNVKRLTPEEQVMATELVKSLVETTQKGLQEDARKMRVGVAHVNPDYTHWYGNSYLNLAITETSGTAKELEMLARKAGSGQDWSKPWVSAFLGITLGFSITVIILRKK